VAASVAKTGDDRLVDVRMPRLSDSMESATILRWLLRPGDQVVKGEPLVEVETDKATIVYEAELDGLLAADRRRRRWDGRSRRSDRAGDRGCPGADRRWRPLCCALASSWARPGPAPGDPCGETARR